MALRGDVVALRLSPSNHPEKIAQSFSTCRGSADTGSQSLATVSAQTAAGDLTPDEAERVASVVEVQRRAVVLQDVERRLAIIEAKLSGSTH